MSEVRLFNDSNAMYSLRDSDFDSVSAYGEVIDNSIQAEAKHIKIKMSTKKRSSGKYSIIKTLAFGDDGNGMNVDELRHCMQLGYSSRYNDRNGIGRFGVGMTLAAIHECKRVEIYSKKTNEEWQSTYIDLDQIAKNDMNTIPPPEKKRIPKEYLNLVGSDSGTLVIWSKYDRQADNADILLKDMINWIGRTYRYFIWDDDINISVNGKLAKAIDPLYYRTEKTNFPDDPQAERFEPIVIPWKVNDFDAPKDVSDEYDITIFMSHLPKEFHQYQGSGGAAETKERLIHMNEGISILRNRREVFYGKIPYWPGNSFKEKDRWWGCEIHFPAVLDRAFTVKNIKRGAVPNKELKETIHKLIKPTRERIIEDITDIWEKAKLKKAEKEAEIDGKPTSGDHEEAEINIKNTPTDRTKIDENKNIDIESEKVVNKLWKDWDEEQKAKKIALYKSQPFTIETSTWRGPQAFEVFHLGGAAVINYNNQHLFIQNINDIIEELKLEECDSRRIAHELRYLIDILIASYAKAEASFDANINLNAEDFIEHLRNNWGHYLKSYIRNWKKENEQ